MANRDVPIRDRQSMSRRDPNQVAAVIVKAVIDVHRDGAPATGFKAERQFSVPVM